VIAALALAAALQTDEYKDEWGCRWKRRPVATQKAAGKPVAKKATNAAKKATRPAKAKPADPDDEFIGCDPEGFAVMRSDLEAIYTIEAETFERGLGLVPPVSEKATQISDSLEEGCDCSSVAQPVSYPVFGGGGFYASPRAVVAPVPEPETWALLLAGLAFLVTKRRKP
jgi:hypothetical protein